MSNNDKSNEYKTPKLKNKIQDVATLSRRFIEICHLVCFLSKYVW